MAAPSFVNSSGPTIDTAGAWTHTCQASGAAGRFFLVHIVQDGTTTASTTVTGATNIENLAGTDNAWTQLATDQIIGSPTSARHHVYVGRALSTSAPTISGGSVSGEDLYIFSLQFQNVSTGTTLADVIENSSAGAFLTGQGTGTTVNQVSVTSLGDDRLGLNICGEDAAVIEADAFSGWTSVGAWSTATGTDAAGFYQHITMPTAATESGGSITILSVGWGIIGFALIGTTVGGTNFTRPQSDTITMSDNAVVTLTPGVEIPFVKFPFSRLP